MVEPVSPSPAVVTAWTRLVRAQHLVLSAIEHDLKTAGFPPLEWYDVLLELSRVDPPGLRPGMLESRLLLAQYNLSRLLDRLVKAELVERTPHPDDARGHFVGLAPAGRELLDRMWPVYRSAIARHVGDRLTEYDARRLGDLLHRLIAPAQPPEAAGAKPAPPATGG